MKKVTKASLSTSVVASGLLLSTALHASVGVYDPGIVASMPQDTINFVNRLNAAGAQAAYMASLPNSARGMRALETYYRNRHEYFIEVLNHNIAILNKGYDIVAQASRSGGPNGKGISDCLANTDGNSRSEQKEWSEIKQSFTNLGLLRQYAETGISSGFPGMERPVLNQNVLNAYNKVGASLDMSTTEGSFWQPVDSCCSRLGADRGQVSICREDYVREKLSSLSNLKKLPSNFVDPMNAGMYAQTLSPEDIVSLMSLGQMQDFIHAKDFNAQVLALQAADMKCINSREDAIAQLNKTGENRSLMLTGLNAVQCSLGNLLRNSSKGVRQVGYGFVNSKVNLWNRTLECSEETKQAAATTLFYSPEAYRADFEHLVSLPTNMLQSQPMAKPIEVYEANGVLSLDLRDEAGFSRETLFIGEDVSPEFAQMQATAAKQAMGQSAMQVVNNGTIIPDGTNQGRVAGRSVINGVGASRGNDERVLVRGLASKTAEGDLESARTLAGATRARKNELKANVEKATKDRSLIADRKVARSNSAQEAASRVLVQEATAEAAKATGRQLIAFREAIGLSSDSGRVVERPGGGSTTSGGGSTVTSNAPANADRIAAAAYKAERDRKAVAEIRSTIRKMADNIVEVAKKANQLWEQKMELAQRISMMADANTFKKIGTVGFDDRADVIMKKQDEIVRLKKEFFALNAQELGARAALATSKSSFKSFVEGAKAFQGLDVRSSGPRAPASTNMNTPMLTQQQQTSLFQMPQVPGMPQGAQQQATPAGLMPPTFNPTPTAPNTGMGVFFPKLIDLFLIPMAHASELTREQKRERFIKEFDAFLASYFAYTRKVEADVVPLKQKAWERFILNEREMRKEPLMAGQERMVLGAFNDTLREEVPDLVKAKVSGNLPSANKLQLQQYIDQIRADSAELNELLIKEATLATEVAPKNVLQDDEVWTGLLPSIALD